ncbi:low molecular weight phosphatase family protein [Microbacterium pumilum]|uniref:Low molecular weight phosphatase family protein n=1 Tax=Microbacterium pumilum TaxID=344165 RepID=A0ABP5DMF4_9MICO
MFEILTVCTGNICRSPLAEQLIRMRLAPLPVRVRSAGTYWLENEPMTPEAVRLAAGFGVPAEDSAAHRSHHLTEQDLVSPDLVLTMTRGHQRDVAALAPSIARSTFPVREFARLSATLTDDELQDAARSAGADAAVRGRGVVAAIASRREEVPPAADLDDDVADPFGQGWAAYQHSAAQLEPAVDEVVRALHFALS